MKRFVLQTFIYSDLFISLCALAMTWETGYVLNLTINWAILKLIFFATLTSYTFHGLVNLVYTPDSDRRKWNAKHKYFLSGLLIFASIFLLFFMIPFSDNSLPFLAGGFFTFLYSAPNLPGKFPQLLRKLVIGKTAYLAIMWTYATTLMPILLLNIPLEKQSFLFFGYRFFLIYAICILFDRRDMEVDKIKGVRSLPTVLNEKHVKLFYYISLILSIIFWIALQNFYWALMVPLLILIPLYRFAENNRSDWLYYVILDGLMALSAFLHAVNFG